jgi:hypothetical protein
MGHTRSRLPRRVRLGRGYVVEVVLASQKTLRDVLDAEDDQHFDGAWDSMLGEDGARSAGVIYIYDRLPVDAKWKTYFHELAHAVTDIAAWDSELRT